MAATIETVTAVTPSWRGLAIQANVLSGTTYIRVTSDHEPDSGTADVVTLRDIYDALQAADSSQTHLVLLGAQSYQLNTWISVDHNITIDIRNTDLIIKSNGNTSQGDGRQGGAGFQLKAFSGTTDAERRAVLTGNNRAVMLTGHTYIFIENRDDPRRGYGPFNHNSTWRNRGGNCVIMVDDDSGNRYDWAANAFDVAAFGTNGQTPDNLGLYDFEFPWTCSLVSISAVRGFAHTLLHPDSFPTGFQILEAMEGGGVGATQPFFFEVVGGHFELPVIGNRIVGAPPENLFGRAVTDPDITLFMDRCKTSGRALSLVQRHTFFDFLGVVATHTAELVDAVAPGENTINALSVSVDRGGLGSTRIAYRWEPTFRGQDGAGLAADGGRLDVNLGLVSRSGTPNGSPVHHSSAQNLGVRLIAGGRIEWDDPWPRSRPEEGRTDRTRNHVRLPSLFTQVGRDGGSADTGSQSTAVWSCGQASWQMFKAGYLPPRTATTLNYPFDGEPYGNLEADVQVPYDRAFGVTLAEVTAARTSASTFYDAESLQLYRDVMYAFETDTETFPAVADAWQGWDRLEPQFEGGIFRLRAAGSEMSFNQTSALDPDNLDPGAFLGFDLANNTLLLRGPAGAGQGYGAADKIDFNGHIPDCTVDAPRIEGTVDASNPIAGLTLRQATVIDVATAQDITIEVNGVVGETLTIENSQAGNILVLTDSGDNVAASGANVSLLIGIRVTGQPAADAASPAHIGVYALVNGAVPPGLGTFTRRLVQGLSEDFTGLAAGTTYRVVWTKAGFEPVVRDVVAEVGRVTVALNPQRTPNAIALSEAPANATLVPQTFDGTNTILRWLADIVRTVDGETVYHADGRQTNALFEASKGNPEFNAATAVLGVTNLIRHPSAQETTLLAAHSRILGADAGLFRHILQAVGTHDAANERGADAAAVQIRQFSALSQTFNLPEAILYPSVVPLTFDEGTRLIEGIDSVTIDALSEAGKDAIIEAVQESGAV